MSTQTKEDTQTYQQGNNTIEIYRRIVVTPGTVPVTPVPEPQPIPTPSPTPTPGGDINKEGVKVLAKRTGFEWELGTDPNNDAQLKLESLGPSTPKRDWAVNFHTVQGKVIHYKSGQADSKTVRFDMFPPNAKGQAQKHTWKDNPEFLWDPSVPKDFCVIGFYRPHKGTGTHTSTSIKVRGGIHTGDHDPRSSDLEMDLPTVGGAARYARELNHPDYDYQKVDTQYDRSVGIEENVWYGLQVLSWVNPDGKSTSNQLYVLKDPFNADGSIKNENWKLFSEVKDVDGHSTGQYTKAPLWSPFVTTLRIDGWDIVDFCKLAFYGIEKISGTPDPVPTPTPIPPKPIPQPPSPVSDVPLPTPIPITKTIPLQSGEIDFPAEFTTKEKWGDNVEVDGAGMDKTILKFNGSQGGGDSALVSINSNIRLKNMTLDASRLVQHSLVCGEGVKLELVNCHFKSGTQITTWTGGNMKTIIAQNCKFSDGSNGDQLAIGVNEAELVENCYFDRSPQDDPGGSCLTHGFARNATIRNNTFTRSKEGFAISFEPWERFGYDGIRCYNNKIVNGDIIIGGPFTALSFTFPYRNIIVTQNDITNGYIHVDAPDLNSQWAKFHNITDIGLGYNQIKDVHLAGNTFQNPAGKQNIVISGQYNEDPLAPVSPIPTPTPIKLTVNDVTKTAQGEQANNIVLQANEADTVGQKIDYNIVTQPANGTLTGGTLPVAANRWSLVYTPNHGFAGKDSFQYQASIGNNKSNVGTVSITVQTPLPPQPPSPVTPTPSPPQGGHGIIHVMMVDPTGNEQCDGNMIQGCKDLTPNKPIGVVYFTHHWANKVEAFPKFMCDEAKSKGCVPFIRMNAYELKSTTVTCASILSGKHDSELQAYAQAAKAWGGTILAEIGTECNGNFLGFSGEGNVAYKTMVRKVITMFKSIAPNVIWFFHGDYNDLGSHPEQWYPGDQYFDWIGTSMYGQDNGKGCIGSLEANSNAAYDTMLKTGNKPLAILEWGLSVISDTTNTLRNIPTKFPKIKLMSYWNEKGSYNRLIQKTPEHLKAYQDGISNNNYTSTYYNP